MRQEIPNCGQASVKQITVGFAVAAHSLAAIKKAAYRLSDRAAFDFRVAGDQVVVRLDLLSEMPQAEAEALTAEFRIEVLDQDLRHTIFEETSAVRNAVLAYAFSRTGLQGQ